MIELKITGKDHVELYNETARMLLLMAQGANALGQQAPIPQPPPNPLGTVATTWDDSFHHHDPCRICGGIEGCDHTVPERRAAHQAELLTTSEAEALPNPSAADPPPEEKVRRGRKPKPVSLELTAEMQQALQQNGAELRSLTGEDHGPHFIEPPALTPKDIRDRVKAIIDAHGARGNDHNACVAYVRKLFEKFPFDETRPIKLIAEMKPEQFAGFWHASASYLEGSAPA